MNFREYLKEGPTFGINIIKTPTGKFVFVGTVPVEHLYVNADGEGISKDVALKIAKSVTPGMVARSLNATTRVFDSYQEAKDYAVQNKIKLQSERI